MSLSAIELARLALSSAAENRRAPWRTRERWFEQRQELQRRILPDAYFYLADVWAQLQESDELAPQYLLRTALDEVNSSDDLRFLRSVAPMCLLRLFDLRAPIASTTSLDELCDSHVHSGGAVPFEDVLDSLLKADASSLLYSASLVEPRTLDALGDPLNVAPLVVGLRLACSHLASFNRHRAPKHWNVDDVFRTASAFSEEAFFRLVGASDDLSTPCWDEIAALVSACRGNPEVVSFVIEALCLLQVALCTSDIASLDLFVDDFERYPSSNIGAFGSAMRWLAPELRRLELRKTFRPTTLSEAAASVRGKLRDFLDEAPLHNDVALQMPLGFLKRDWASPSNPTKLGSQLALAEAFADEYSILPREVRPIISGLDVAGNERTQFNFVYVNAFNHFIAKLTDKGVEAFPVVLSAHAGESWEDPLGGLRAIGEFVQFVPSIRRIGHGLALDAMRSRQHYLATKTQRPRADLALLDLCWARSVISIQSPWRKSFDYVLRALGDVVFDGVDGLSPNDLVDWYLSLFDLKTMLRHREIPIGGRLPGSASYEIEGELTFQMTESLLYPKSSCPIRFNAESWVSGGLAVRVREARRSLYPHMRDWLVGAIKHRVVIEVCPTSNCRLGRYVLSEHPIRQFIEAELPCTVSTDDPALFSTTLSDEYAALAGVLDTPARAKLLADSRDWTASALGSGPAWDYAALRRLVDAPVPR